MQSIELPLDGALRVARHGGEAGDEAAAAAAAGSGAGSGSGSAAADGEAATDGEAVASATIELPDGYEPTPLPSFKGLVSPCFEPYMGGYVQLEKRCAGCVGGHSGGRWKLRQRVPTLVRTYAPALTHTATLPPPAARLPARSKTLELMEKTLAQERVDRDGALPVLASSLDLFLAMKNASQRCLPLSNGQTFFLLYKEFKALLREYANRLLAKLPKPAGPGEAAHLYRFPDDDAVDLACFVVNTAQYCAETIPQLETMIKVGARACLACGTRGAGTRGADHRARITHPTLCRLAPSLARSPRRRPASTARSRSTLRWTTRWTSSARR